MDKLFIKFAAYYGQLWRSQFKDDNFVLFMKKEWSEALSCFDDQVFDKAIKHCREYKELPPTLPYFVALCKAMQQPKQSPIPENNDPIRTFEVAESNLIQMKEYLRGAAPPRRKSYY